jgi:TonB family protein
MSNRSVALRQQKQLSFPMMLFVSILVHIGGLLVLLIAPSLLPRHKPEPFGGPSGSGGNVMWVSTAGLGRIGKPSARNLTQQEPAPARYISKTTKEEEVPLLSKTVLPDLKPKKKQDEPTAKETLNQRERKKEGEFGRGTDTSKDSGKSGNEGKGKFGVGTFGVGEGGEGGYGTGTGVPFPFPWYIENVFTKLELSWVKPILTDSSEQEYLVVLYFVILKNGQVRNVTLEQSSGIPALDRSAQSAILGAAPFPPLPYQWTEPELAFRVRFVYTR